MRDGVTEAAGATEAGRGAEGVTAGPGTAEAGPGVAEAGAELGAEGLGAGGAADAAAEAGLASGGLSGGDPPPSGGRRGWKRAAEERSGMGIPLPGEGGAPLPVSEGFPALGTLDFGLAASFSPEP